MTSGGDTNSSVAVAAAASQQQQQPKISINLSERDIIKMIIEFLHSHDLHISQLDLERETGVINSQFSDDVVFLRQLVLDGQWDDVLEFIEPLKKIPTFDAKQFTFIVMKHQYLELLCLKTEATGLMQGDNQLSVEQLVAYLNELRQYAPNDDEYKKLCLLVTSPRLQDHQEYRNWNPASGRLQCFRELQPLVTRYLEMPIQQQPQRPIQQIAQNERLVQLLVKGLLYEACVEYCQARATNSPETYNISDPGVLLSQQQLSETDASLLSWLHALPVDTFSCPFEEKPLRLDIDRFSKPPLEPLWADAILATPIKPQKLFPFACVPSGRSRSTELMSRSLAPQYDGLGFGLLGRSQLFASGVEMKLTDAVANASPSSNGSFKFNGANGKNTPINNLTHSIGIFNLDNVGSSSATSAENNKSSSISPKQSSSQPSKSQASTSPTPEAKEDDALLNMSGSMHDSQLFNEYKRNKAQILKQLDEQDRKRDEYIKQLKSPNVYSAALNAVSRSLGQQQQQQQAIGKKQPQTSLYETGATGTILEEEEEDIEDEVEQNQAISPNVGRSGQNGASRRQQAVVTVSSSSLSPPAAELKQQQQQQQPQQQQSPRVSQQQMSPNQSTLPESSGGTKQQRPIAETHKFDSLEDITKAASFQPICMIEDLQAIRAVDIHPSGEYYVVGSNSKCLRVCHYPNLSNIKSDYVCKPASVLYKKSKHHYGSIYCVAWNSQGNLIATGSNDKTIKLVKFSPDLSEDTESESELTCHNGTVRDLIFMHQTDSSILVSGGAGDCKIHVTDCTSMQSVRTFSGHSQHVYTLYSWPSTRYVFVSGSADRTCRFWDLRTSEAIQVVRPTTDLAMQVSPVASVAVDPSGLLLASGHEDAACSLYDIRGARIVQCYKPHQADIRSVRFSTNAYYLLTASYDSKVIITDLHGDLTKPLNWSVVAGHSDKIIQAKWHPTQMSFVTTSADRTSTVWSLPTAALASASVI